MSQLLARYWNCRRHEVLFNPTNGHCRLRWFRSRKGTAYYGWAFRHRRRWYCLWNDAGVLRLHLGAQSWPLGTTTQFLRELIPGTTRCRFRVVQGADVPIEVTYRNPTTRFMNRFDPSYDRLDEEREDFFLWLASLSADPDRLEAIRGSLLVGARSDDSFGARSGDSDDLGG